ncbi:uncharacterized protein METZ01_LOCUS202367 [marine metagenome]|uniref:Phage tail assembly chaperone-like domain-containing protein n=1 Tax=marine metagenome TaxID=408172 RepID=A0A382EHU7_9ZZZZ
MATYDWAMCEPETGQIQYIMSVNNNSDFSHASKYKGFITIQIESGVDQIKAIEESYWDYEDAMFKSRIKKPTKFYVWGASKQWVLDNAALMAELRTTRNSKLTSCDWTQVADSALTDEKKAEWVTYRQNLRDVTKDISEELSSLENFAWPTEPS